MTEVKGGRGGRAGREKKRNAFDHKKKKIHDAASRNKWDSDSQKGRHKEAVLLVLERHSLSSQITTKKQWQNEF